MRVSASSNAELSFMWRGTERMSAGGPCVPGLRPLYGCDENVGCMEEERQLDR